MTIETSRATLINLLLTGYEDLKRRLSRRLGSTDMAADALQDTFLRLYSSVEIGPIKRPNAYILRIATRLAADRRRAELLGGPPESEFFLDIVDDAPDPERIVEARSEIEALKRGMMEMPQRRRDILLAVSIDEVPSSALAKRFGVTKRTIQAELKLALIHCAKQLDRDIGIRMPARRSRISPSFSSDVNGNAEEARGPDDGGASNLRDFRPEDSDSCPQDTCLQDTCLQNTRSEDTRPEDT
ncbi:RNA polymerase sigma factor [Methylosinus sp. H3A]|uniref:RNA polymerase sigma factor n=1 Tax=Methylosinus sp. H3A TaxID=2785786 RepID=UPI0018C1F328|nr:RNA polymerase sigma factor [Methylosinus sp. H3A]MBG0812610.1 RNA polymerase sigma factor [Methylosinus sp. H3A]